MEFEIPVGHVVDQSTKIVNLLNRGVPAVAFQRVVRSPSTKHTSDHKAVECETKNATLGEFSREDAKEWIDYDQFGETSGLLLQLKKIHPGNKIMMSSEQDVRLYVELLIRDAISIAGLDAVLTFLNECSITVERTSKKTHRGDFYVVARRDGRPLLVIEVKSPDVLSTPSSPSILDDIQVVGQIADHMLDLSTFFGQEDVFGISTTFSEWKFHWFPHSSDVASATTMGELAQIRPPGQPLHGPNLQRAVCSTRIYSHSDASLVTTLVTVLHKSYRSRMYTKRIIDPNRLYLSLSGVSWDWKRLSTQDSAKHHQCLTLRPSNSTKTCTIFTVVRYFQKGPDHKVWLCMVGLSPGCVLVVKLCEDLQAAEWERELWSSVNQCETWTKKVHGEDALCMPLVILAHHNCNTGLVSFDFDLRNWCCHDASTDFPLRLQQLAADIIAASVAYRNARAVAVAAINRCAAQLIDHGDVEWRHVGLLPVVNENDRLVELRPVLVDFGRAVRAPSVEAARKKMIEQLDSREGNFLDA